jgi:hypothetical protein
VLVALWFARQIFRKNKEEVRKSIGVIDATIQNFIAIVE